MKAVLACCLFVTAQLVSTAGAQEGLQPANFRPSETVTDVSAAAPPASEPADPATQPPPSAAEAVSANPSWRVLRTAWTERDERAYEEFVQRIGESDCRNVHDCLTDAKSNPLYRASNPPGMHFYSDCADLPYMLRAYFAWKNGLPFSYSTAVSPAGYSEDIRYNEVGNRISSRRDLTGPEIDGRRAVPQMMVAVTSAHYRYAPNYSGNPLLTTIQ